MIILQRKTIDKKLFYEGVNSERVMFVHSENGFILSELFELWADEIFLPHVKQQRGKYSYKGPAIIFIDGCTCHLTDNFLDSCVFGNIIVSFIPPHSSDQLQVLDLGLFGVHKANMRSISVSNNFSPQSKEILRILNGWIKTATVTNILHAWRRAGFEVFTKDQNILFYKVNTKYAFNVVI